MVQKQFNRETELNACENFESSNIHTNAPFEPAVNKKAQVYGILSGMNVEFLHPLTSQPKRGVTPNTDRSW